MEGRGEKGVNIKFSAAYIFISGPSFVSKGGFEVCQMNNLYVFDVELKVSSVLEMNRLT